jgi:hypothetical protein
LGAPFSYYKRDRFTKTGLGQTHREGEHSKKKRRFPQEEEAAAREKMAIEVSFEILASSLVRENRLWHNNAILVLKSPERLPRQARDKHLKYVGGKKELSSCNRRRGSRWVVGATSPIYSRRSKTLLR